MHRLRALMVLIASLASADLMAQEDRWVPLDDVRRTEQPAIRDVSGGRIMRVTPDVEGRLRRLPSRAAAARRDGVEAPMGPDVQRFHRVVFEAAGRFRTGTRTIALAGLTAPEADQTCAARSRASWPCGRHALFAVRRFVRTRAVECTPAIDDGDAVEGATPHVCRIGNVSLNAWIVSQGWAAPTEDRFGRLMRTHHEVARRKALGLFGEPVPD